MRRSLEGRRSLKGLSPNLLAIGIFLLVFLYTLHSLFLSQYNLFRVFQLKRSIGELQVKIDQYRENNEKMEQLLELIKKHPEHFKERFTRNYMQMQRDDEYILLFKDLINPYTFSFLRWHYKGGV